MDPDPLFYIILYKQFFNIFLLKLIAYLDPGSKLGQDSGSGSKFSIFVSTTLVSSIR